MTDLWVDAHACTPIMVTVDGDGPVDDDGAIPKRQLCWICLTPWPCDAYRTGSLNTAQLAAIRDDDPPENPDA